MENEALDRLTKIERRVEEIYVSAERTRKYLLWTMIVTVAVLVLPLVGLMFAIPAFISSYSSLMAI